MPFSIAANIMVFETPEICRGPFARGPGEFANRK
jgi:hypothetical protein